MKPLAFLWGRSFVNGIKRNLGSARRLISLLAILGYYFFVVARPPGMFTGGLPNGPGFGGGRVDLPHPRMLDPIVFVGFALLTLVLSAGVLAPRGSFRPADVDVLFPTPVSPKLVLVFRILRDYVLTLLLPLFFAVLGWRGTLAGTQALERNFPQHAAYVARAASVAWIMVALCWVTISYAASLFVGRSDLQSDRNRKVIGWTIFVAIVSVLLYSSLRLRDDLSWATAREVAESPLLRIVFFTATAATALVMAR